MIFDLSLKKICALCVLLGCLTNQSMAQTKGDLAQNLAERQDFTIDEQAFEEFMRKDSTYKALIENAAISAIFYFQAVKTNKSADLFEKNLLFISSLAVANVLMKNPETGKERATKKVNEDINAHLRLVELVK